MRLEFKADSVESDICIIVEAESPYDPYTTFDSYVWISREDWQAVVDHVARQLDPTIEDVK